MAEWIVTWEDNEGINQKFFKNIKIKHLFGGGVRSAKDTAFYLHGMLCMVSYLFIFFNMRAAADELIGSTGKIPGGAIWFFGPWEPVFTRGTGLKFIMHALSGLPALTERSLEVDVILF